METVILKVFRYDPDKDSVPYYKDYEVPVEGTLLNALLYVKDNLDPTLSFRAFCRSEVCGSCAVRVNGKTKLACKTPMKELYETWKGKLLKIEPLNHMKVIKDLVTDIDEPIEKMKSLMPWLVPDPSVVPSDPMHESIIYPEEMELYKDQIHCMLCFSCYSACEAVEDNERYRGPFAFSRAYRFQVDRRDIETAKDRRIRYAISGGLWSCVQCQKCLHVCPKGVKPAEDIQNLRRRSIKKGFTDKPGAKKLKHYVDWIYATGQINRLYLPAEVYGDSEAEKLKSAYESMGAEVWEVPKPVKGLLKFRDTYLEILSKSEEKAMRIDFSHVREIDRLVSDFFKADICTVLDRVSSDSETAKGLVEKLKSFFGGN
ncbi:succinate dehydrogenase / fumarate reductase iron-sulfur subunit [Desulfurobacterium pacificum]|uniref:Fumarate reductase iron-sulfur subunit n=1 Tax=Desulfurobacterium pacificum TaxID=240166 RepID=A0ABY1NCG5_9BACT|nr:succinate dehydrogenase/fumarate reductase iron-sulfur subunit [Desulfurobacterium pacificum]SMP06228.1 succinate dehydrogenase / fumarate reductase iron-sulfur subunit [Desulfurobacterium pacificum]